MQARTVGRGVCSGRRRRPTSRRQLVKRAAKAPVVNHIHFLCRLNSTLNLLNKWALGVYGFRFPLLLTSCKLRAACGTAALPAQRARAGMPDGPSPFSSPLQVTWCSALRC